jgi:hypothetical protein
MLSPDDYRHLAERCAVLASECAAPGVAEALKALAADYLAHAVCSTVGSDLRTAPLVVPG